MATGFGSQKAGSTGGGFAPAQDLNPNGSKVLARQYLVQQTGSRRIDPKTGDYVLDPTWGRIRGMPNVQQLVLLAIHTKLGSSCIPTLGQDIYKMDRIGSNFERDMESRILKALQFLVDRRFIQILSIEIERLRVPGRAFARVKWRDLSTALEHLEEVFGG